jgi:tetratricopeptide (TPR) repeat protein
MDEKTKEILEIEKEIEAALWTLEVRGENEKAYEVYLEAETKLGEIEITNEEPAYSEQQRVLAYCLMRQGNFLRQMGRSKEALTLSEREMKAARASKDEITLARSLMSNGARN